LYEISQTLTWNASFRGFPYAHILDFISLFMLILAAERSGPRLTAQEPLLARDFDDSP
jgi:hypothetical protein